MKLSLDNWRWADVPFYVRTGKRMHCKHSTSSSSSRRLRSSFFVRPASSVCAQTASISISSPTRITLHFGAKVPGPIVNVGPVDMDFNYHEHFGDRISTGYERLLYDCMIGDATLFQRADMIEAAWAVVTPVIDVWNAIPPRDFPNYAAGSWGPRESDEMVAVDGRVWKNTHERV